MKNKRLFLLIVACFAYNKNAQADNIITYFLKPYPLTEHDAYSKKINRKLSKPGKIAKHTANGIINRPWIDGIFSSYAGFLEVSDDEGRTLFPRRHEEPKVTLLITSKITPIIMTGNTVHHWELEKGTPAYMVTIQREQDLTTNLYFWNVIEMDLPQNNIVPLDTVVLFAKPKNIYVPLGITLTSDSPHLVLPDIYIKKGINVVKRSLYVLNIKQFFGTISRTQDTSKPAIPTIDETNKDDAPVQSPAPTVAPVIQQIQT